MKHVTITETDDITAAKVDAQRNVDSLSASASLLAEWHSVTRTAMAGIAYMDNLSTAW